MLKAGSGTAVQCADILLQHQTPGWAGFFCTSPALFMTYVEKRRGERVATVIPSQELTVCQLVISLTFINENQNLTEMPWQMIFSLVLFNNGNGLTWWRKWASSLWYFSVLAFLGSISSSLPQFVHIIGFCALQFSLSCAHPSHGIRSPCSGSAILLLLCWAVCFGPAFLFPLQGRQSAVHQENVNYIKYLWPLVWGAAVQMCSVAGCHRGRRRLNIWS